MSETQFTGRMPRRAASAPPLDPEKTQAELRRFLELVLRQAALALEFEIAVKEGESGEAVVATFRGDDEPLLLERNGELLLALEHLAHRWLRLDPALHERVRLDCRDFRSTRTEELKLLARVAAQRVRETGQPFRFNPMSSRERRVIHLELNSAPDVRTVSEGSGPRRGVVIYPATAKDQRSQRPQGTRPGPRRPR